MNQQGRFPFAAVLCWAVLSGFGPAALAQSPPLLELSDPADDDLGDGSLVMPREPVIEPGDLDLRSLRVFEEAQGLRFELVFRNPVRDPAQVKSGLLGSEDLALFARRGFFAFNFDLYLDIDRLHGSGQTVALPGRRARFDAAHAWDKAIVLTPRPELMRRQLQDALAEAASETTQGGAQADVDASIDRSVFFVRDVRVRGRTVSFTVPNSFVPTKAFAGASIVGMVTAARLAIEADVGGLFARGTTRAVDRLPLGVAMPEAGRPALGIGYRGDRAPATSIVDLLVPDAAQQQAQLAAGVLQGLNRENRYGATLPAAAPVAAQAPLPVASSEGGWFARALGALFGGAAARPAPAAAAAAAPAPSLQDLLAPTGTPTAGSPPSSPGGPTSAPATPSTSAPVVPARPAAVAAPVPAVPSAPATPSTAAGANTPAPAPVPTARGVAPTPAAAAPAPGASRAARDAAFFEEQEHRLRTLRRLRDRDLISEEEFQRKRKEVLDAL